MFGLKGRLLERIREYGPGILIHGVFAVEL